MSVFNPAIPTPTDFLADSQGQLLQNFNKSNSSFGTDHYPFSDLTTNNGFHNQVTTPAYVANPPTGLPPVTVSGIPKMYAFADTANVGVINYSRTYDIANATPAVPTPLSHLHSTSAAIVLGPGASTNILDFTGIARAFCILYAMDIATVSTSKLVAAIFWTGAAFTINGLSSTSLVLAAASTGNILQLKNVSGGSANNVYWTLQMDRLS